ncbi:GAF domain-containing sensor histidine kinase [Coleofasciculus sp. F4-SAH-05]|uniref:GAF domain-containing sensor histidine kinase n=1 Tax=Coleofasciculus sp. F4-SAH-05 TaxID=3069525 RepID=UPI004063E724
MIAPADFHHPRFGYTTMQSTTAQGKSSFLQELEVELMCSQDASGQYHSFYWRQAEQYDLTQEQVIGVPLNETFHPIALDAYRDRIQRILDNRTPERCIHDFCYGDQVFPFELVISPILQADGQATQVWVMGHLLPEGSVQKVIDSLVPLSVDPNQKLLTQIARRIRRTLDLDTIWQQTVDSLGKALQVSRCIICSYKPDYTDVKVEAEYRQESLEEMLGMTLELESELIMKQAMWSSEPVVVDQVAPSRFQEKSLLVVSTSYKDEPNGLISLQQCDRHRQWSDAEIELVRELAEQVGTAIAHGTLYKELELAREQAEEVSRLKSEFLASTSHELRTPLNGMIGFLKLILEGMADDPEEQREFIQEAHNSALHLLNIINDILDIAKIEAGKMELEFSPVELEYLFNKVYDFTAQQAHHKNLSFTLEIPAVYDGIVMYGNYQRLLQVMLNLVGNAIKFTDEGGITISAEVIRKKVHFQGQEFPGHVKVRVADTGIGVSLDKQDKLFQSFSQVHGGLNRPYGGTGLGLAISQKLVETMGGVVHFFSMGENLGSTVTFTVPLYQEPVMVSRTD